MVCGTMVAAKAGLGGGTGGGGFRPSGEAGLENHGIEFGEDRGDGEAAVVVGIKRVAFAFEDGMHNLAVEGAGKEEWKVADRAEAMGSASWEGASRRDSESRPSMPEALRRRRRFSAASTSAGVMGAWRAAVADAELMCTWMG